MRSDPDDLDVLASDEVTELFGWPVTLLDELADLRQLARHRTIDIEEWRRRDKELRDARPGPHPLTSFPRCVVEAAGRGDQDAAVLAEQVLRLWKTPEAQRFLLRE